MPGSTSRRIQPPAGKAARQVEAILRRHRVRLTMGGEPTYVPESPHGAEWSHSAVGPTKLDFARRMADALVRVSLPGAEIVFTPGKHYPGEPDPRWSLQLLAPRDGGPLMPRSRMADAPARHAPGGPALARFRRDLSARLGPRATWHRIRDPRHPESPAWVLPLDADDDGRWISRRWRARDPSAPLTLLDTDAPAGLRLPLDRLTGRSLRRALCLQVVSGIPEIFLPPLPQPALIKLLETLDAGIADSSLPHPSLAGYLPPDQLDVWIRVGIAADPGVIEVNIPPCPTWTEYARWISDLERAAESAGLRSWKRLWHGQPAGTGGGNHILFGGPSLERNPFFPRPSWLARALRFWQAHPSLSYLFTGIYVGSSSQAPRPDESARDLRDLEMAYAFLESLDGTMDRNLINETIRHMHTDASGNTHRTEISVDKFWTPNTPAGCQGLVEFRAVESLPRADWMAAVGLLWRAILAVLLEKEAPRPLTPHGGRLHDAFFLPTFLARDLGSVLDFLDDAGVPLDRSPFQDILDWRLPVLHEWSEGDARLQIRAALEGWPLLSEVPADGGNTSRFVDTSVERIEIRMGGTFARSHRVVINGVAIPTDRSPDDDQVVGLRFRRTALYPCLHPGIPVDVPLRLDIIRKHGSRATASAILPADDYRLIPARTDGRVAITRRLPPLDPSRHTHDLRTATTIRR